MKGTNTILDQTGYVWLYALFLWVLISNCMDKPSHGHLSTYKISFGTTPDTIQFMQYKLWDPIYYYDTEKKFPSTKEQCGHWLGPAQHFGDVLTYWILTKNKIVLA